jgi:pimeloyl-ACP methyl ester carboxylesterase
VWRDTGVWPGEPDSLVVTTSDGAHIHYLDWRVARGGDPQSAVFILIHGLGQTSWSWAPVARRLAPVADVVALDLRGHGLSDSPRDGYDLESLAYDALTVMSANGWGTDVDGLPAVVGGHGLGAMVAAAMAVARPDSVAGVGLIDAGWEDLAEATGLTAPEFERTLGDPPEVLASMDAFLRDRREYDLDSWDADQERAARSTVDEKHAGHVAPVVRAHVQRGVVDAMFSYRPNVAALLAQPLLVAVAESGTADDETLRERLAALQDFAQIRADRGLPDLLVRRFAGSGHNLMRYRPDDLTVALVELAEQAYQRS